MQRELDTENLPTPVRILGVNGVGFESGNAAICSGRDIPWLQDRVGAAVWTSWGVTYRDVIILDAANEPVDVYNLTTYNLADAESYAALKALLRAAAGGATP